MEFACGWVEISVVEVQIWIEEDFVRRDAGKFSAEEVSPCEIDHGAGRSKILGQ